MQKTFRLFVSSTFGDFSKEREILHKEVFPKIDKYCNKVGFSFQPIDLRWGVSSDASNDQKTLEVCLEEVRACKHFPYPNFLIMAGDRYGTVILPYMIEQIEFKTILEQINNDEDKKLLLEWYILDENQIYINKENKESSAYILKPRSGKYTDRENWKPVNARLLDILQDASQKAFDNNEITEKQKEKYFISATEAEVIEGILDYKEETENQKKLKEDKVIESPKVDKEYVYGYTRTIENASGDYIDKHKDEAKLKELEKKAQEFKKTLSETLDNENNIKPLKFNSVKDYEDSNLKEFEDFIYKKLIDAIDIQKNKVDETSNLKKEKSEQQKFKNDKVEGFQGREKTLNEIQKYISNEETTQPLVIHGPSGMGKSSLIAQAINQTEERLDGSNLIYRFVGATQNSTTIRNLLISICNELKNEDKQSNEYELEEYKFNEQIKNILSNIESPTTIFIDALDQLQFKDSLQWLPGKLNLNLKIIFSVLNDDKYEETGDNHYYKFLSSRVSDEYLLDILKDSLEDQKNTLISNLLNDLKRKLNPIQEKYLLKKWIKTKYSPLYLKIAIEEVKHWKSYDYIDVKYIPKDPETEQECNIVNHGSLQNLQSDVVGIIEEYLENLTKLFHHEEIFVNKVFGYIHASKDGLNEKELLQIVSEDLEDEQKFQKKILSEQYEAIKIKNPRRDNKEELVLPMSLWSRLHTQIKPFIIERNIDNQPLMKFFHRQFTTVIDDLTKENQIKLHTKLSEYFYTLQNKNETWDKRYHNLHMLSEYPYQLFYSKQSEELKEILFDLEFAGSVYDNNKQDSFRDIMEKASQLNDILEDDIYPWESFYREKDHLISKVNDELWKAHQSLFQLAYEDGGNSPLTKEAGILLKNRRIKFNWFKRTNCPSEFYRTGLVKIIKENGPLIDVHQLDNGDILSVSDDNSNSIKIWTADGELRKSLPDDERIIVQNLTNGNILYYFPDDLSLQIWSIEGEVLEVIKDDTVFTNLTLGEPRRAIKKLHDGRSLKYSTDYKDNDYALKIWDKNGELSAVLEGHSDTLNGALELNNGKILSYSEDGTIRIWNGGSNCLKIFDETSSQNLDKVLILSDMKILSYYEYNDREYNLRIWSDEGKLLRILSKHTDAVTGALELSDGRILSYSKDKTLLIWSNNEWPIVLNVHRDVVTGALELNDGRILSYSEDGTVIIWSQSGELLKVLDEHHRCGVRGILELYNGNIITYSTYDFIVMKNTGEILKEKTTYGNIDNVIKLGNEKFLVCSSYENENLLIIYDNNGCVLTSSNSKDKINGGVELSNSKFLTYTDDNLIIWTIDEFKLYPVTIIKEHRFPKKTWKNLVKGIQKLRDGNILIFSDSNLIILNKDDYKIEKYYLALESYNIQKVTNNGQIYLSDRSYFKSYTFDFALNNDIESILKSLENIDEIEYIAYDIETLKKIHRLYVSTPDIYVNEYTKSLKNLGEKLYRIGKINESLKIFKSVYYIHRDLFIKESTRWYKEYEDSFKYYEYFLNSSGKVSEVIQLNKEALNLFRYLYLNTPDKWHSIYLDSLEKVDYLLKEFKINDEEIAHELHKFYKK